MSLSGLIMQRSSARANVTSPPGSESAIGTDQPTGNTERAVQRKWSRIKPAPRKIFELMDFHDVTIISVKGAGGRGGGGGRERPFRGVVSQAICRLAHSPHCDEDNDDRLGGES